MAERIGMCACPVCGRTGAAHMSLAKNGWVCITCNACKMQLQCRGDESDSLCRERWPAQALPPVVPSLATQAGGAPAPGPDAPAATKPAPPAPPAEPVRRGWGIFG